MSTATLPLVPGNVLASFAGTPGTYTQPMALELIAARTALDGLAELLDGLPGPAAAEIAAAIVPWTGLRAERAGCRYPGA